ncbi:MAG: hypothetical protein U0790_24910 [Isosphaeraceae bacterium]
MLSLRDRRAPRGSRARRPRLESLEGRLVLSAVFDSVLDVGNDTASIFPKDVAVDSAGNRYVTGLLYGQMDMDPNVERPDGSDILTPLGSQAGYVAKYAPDNTLLWARAIGSSYQRSTNPNDPFEQGRSIAVDASGNVYVSGDFVGQVSFGSTVLTGTGSTDAYVTKLDTNGNYLWAQRWGSSSTREFANAITVDASGNVYSAGFTANLTSTGAWWASGFEIRKYSPSGAAVWDKRFNNAGGIADAVGTDAAGNVYVCGSFNGTLDFNPDPRKTSYVTGASGYSGGQAFNGFVLKLTSSGAFSRVSPFIAKASNSRISCQDLALDGAGNVIVGGTYSGQVDVNPSSSVDTRLPNLTTSDGYVAKLSSSGALSWATPLGGATVWGIDVDAAGSIYATGTFYETLIPGSGLPSVTTQGSNDVFLTKFNATGSVAWVSTIGGTGTDLCYAVAVGTDGSIHLAGVFYSTVDFDPDAIGTHQVTNTKFGDMFLLRLTQS